MSSRISDLAVNLSAKRNFTNTQKESAEARIRKDTASISTSYSNESTALNTRSILKAAQDKILANDKKMPIMAVKETIQTTYDSVVHMRDIATELRVRVIKARDPVTPDPTFKTFCQTKLDELEAILNKRNSLSAPIFGGTSRDPKAVDFSLVPTPAPADPVSMATNNYFKGVSGGNNTSLDENHAINYGCSADETAIKDLIFWLKKGTAVDPSPVDSDPGPTALGTMVDGLEVTTRELSLLAAKQGDILATVITIEKTTSDTLYQTTKDLNDLTAANMAQEMIRAAEADERLQLQMTNYSNNLRQMRQFIDKM